MHIHRLGDRWLVLRTRDSFVYDAARDEFMNVPDPAAWLGADAIKWRPVLDYEPLPPALEAALILLLRPPRD